MATAHSLWTPTNPFVFIYGLIYEWPWVIRQGVSTIHGAARIVNLDLLVHSCDLHHIGPLLPRESAVHEIPEQNHRLPLLRVV